MGAYTLTMWLIILTALCYSIEAQSTVKFDWIVAKDGTGNYSKISDAVSAVPPSTSRRYYIKIKEGNYTEYITIEKQQKNITFIGDGMDKTIISGDKSLKRDNLKTYQTATVGIYGDGFVAMNMTFENTAGPQNGQAVAVTSEALSSFYMCRFLGYQDTLYTKRNKQFYRDCHIYGTVDFIFGDAAVVFQNCVVYARHPGQGNEITITAQGREEKNGLGGTVIHNCTITATEDLRRNHSSVKTYLGRPWKTYARTIIMQSYIDGVVDPQGWLEWNNTDTIFYAEYGNRGPGANTEHRVQWKGYKRINQSEATYFTVRNFINGYQWIPYTGIPFYPDLM